MVAASEEMVVFVRESNGIEGIFREPTARELQAHVRFWALDQVAVSDLEEFVQVVASATLRREVGDDVRVGPYAMPPGGPGIETGLQEILDAIHGGFLNPWEAHAQYESLHPFNDGNGRSGRALWAWQMMRDGRPPFAMPFLQRWYYQSLRVYQTRTDMRGVSD